MGCSSSSRRPLEDTECEAKRAIDLYWTCRMGNHQVAGSLVTSGAAVNVRHPDSGDSPLHAATAHGHFKVVQLLLARGADPNLRSSPPQGETPLHFAVRTAQQPRAQWTRSRALECLRLLLLDKRTKPDKESHRGVTPLHLATQHGLWDFVKSLLAAGASVDVPVLGETARQIILRENPSLLELAAPEPQQLTPNTKAAMLDDLRTRREEQLIHRLSKEPSIKQHTLQMFLQYCSVHNMRQLARYLMDRGADPTSSQEDSEVPCVILAARHGNHEVLRELLSGPGPGVVDHPLWRRTALHHAVLAAGDMAPEQDEGSINLAKCVALLLERSRHLDVNAIDFLGNTALHYAAKSNRKDLVKLILKQRPALFLQSHENVPAFLHVYPRTLEKHLDDFVTLKGTGKIEKFPTLVLDYSFLCSQSRPVGSSTLSVKEEEQRLQACQENASLLEMAPLVLLSRSPLHRPLLKHPAITSFLHLKWQRVKSYFFINFLLYLLFSVTLSLHIYFLITANSEYPSLSRSNQTNDSWSHPYEYGARTPHNIIRWLAAFFTLWPLCREVLEMCMAPRRYVRNVENLMETTLVLLAIVLIFVETSHYSQQIMSSVAILLTYIDLIFLIGRHPKFATYITMFTRVSRNFLGFFILFSFFLFAFAFSFFVIFYDCLPSQTCETRFFANPASSIFKTIIMLTGELEAETIQFDLFGYLLYILFVLFITICLHNLLTGLAVSDIAAIREEAEVESCRAKVKLYAKIEAILLGHMIEGVSGDHWLMRPLRGLLSRLFARRVRLLDHTLPERRLEVSLTLDHRMEPEVVTSSWRSRVLPCVPPGQLRGHHHDESWDETIAKSLNVAAARKAREALAIGDHDRQIKERLDTLELKLSQLIEMLTPNLSPRQQ